MEMLKTPLVDVTARLDLGLLFDAMALLEAGIWTCSPQQGLRRAPSCLRLLGLGDRLERVHSDDVAPAGRCPERLPEQAAAAVCSSNIAFFTTTVITSG